VVTAERFLNTLEITLGEAFTGRKERQNTERQVASFALFPTSVLTESGSKGNSQPTANSVIYLESRGTPKSGLKITQFNDIRQ